MSKGRVVSHEDKTEVGAGLARPFGHCQEYGFYSEPDEGGIGGF